MVELARDDPLERRDRILELDVLALEARELRRHKERLRQEPLHPTRARNQQLVFLGQLVHPEDGDDVLEILVTLQNALHLYRHVVVTLAQVLRVEDAARGRTAI